MKAPHIIVHNGKWYKAGEELPEEVERSIRTHNEESQKSVEEIQRSENPSIMAVTNKTN